MLDGFLAEPLRGTTWGVMLAVVIACVTPMCLLLTWLLNVWQARRKVRRDDFAAFTEAMARQHHAVLAQNASQQRQIDQNRMKSDRQDKKFKAVGRELKRCREDHRQAREAHEKCDENLASVNAQLAEVRTGLAEVKKNGNGGAS